MRYKIELTKHKTETTCSTKTQFSLFLSDPELLLVCAKRHQIKVPPPLMCFSTVTLADITKIVHHGSLHEWAKKKFPTLIKFTNRSKFSLCWWKGWLPLLPLIGAVGDDLHQLCDRLGDFILVIKIHSTPSNRKIWSNAFGWQTPLTHFRVL